MIIEESSGLTLEQRDRKMDYFNYILCIGAVITEIAGKEVLII